MKRAAKLSDLLRAVDSPAGRRKVAQYLKTLPYPHYEAAPNSSDLLIRIEADGKRTVGKFVNRTFQSINSKERAEGATRPKLCK
jgi:hypothetical protein